MKFVFAVLCLIVAEEIIQLDPVTALYDDYPCSHWTSTNDCIRNPFCYWASSQCRFDTCLMAAGDDWNSDVDCSTATGNASCKYVSTNIPYKDDTTCTNPNTPTPGYRYVCRFQAPNQGSVDLCTYEYLRSGKTACDSWKCQPGAKDAANKEFCATPSSRSKLNCLDLTTKDYCSLNPHCYWEGSSCVKDVCTDYDVNCDTYFNTNNAPTAKCASYTIFDGASSTSGATKIMCVDPSKNAAPNKCFDLAEGGSPSANRPSTGTGLCATYTLPKCSANSDCSAQFSGSGPFGDYYCGDAAHSAEDFSIIAHTPSVIIILLAVLTFFL